MKIILKPGETITVKFEDSDGEIEVSFGGREPDALTIHTDLPDNTFNREGVIYREDFSHSPNEKEEMSWV